MRKIKACTFCFFLLFMSACGSDSPQVYVKNISLSKNENIFRLSLVYYDFNSPEEQYRKAEYMSDDIYKIGINAMNDKNYNFRLCENIFLYPEIFISDIDKAVYMINSLKISPNANVVCYTGQNITQDMYGDELSYNPVHSISVDENHADGIFPVQQEDGRIAGFIFTEEGKSVRFLDRSHAAVFAMGTNTIDNVEYVFRNDNMWASLEDIDTVFSFDKEILNVNISFRLKDYKGIQNSIQSKDMLINMLKKDIANKAYKIYDDVQLAETQSLHWYCRQKGIKCTDIKINIDVR